MQYVLVNGGSRGIGAEIVRLFCEKGYGVAFTYAKSVESAEKLARETGALAIKADSSSESDIIRAVGEAEEAFGHIDILVNNAAISSFRLVTELSTEEWNRTLAVNLTAPFLFAKAVLPAMIRRQKGRIINIVSMWGEVGSSCETHYSASKGGLIAFTKALAKEVGPSGITVNAVSPGVIMTEMNASLSEEDMKTLADETPLLRIGAPRDIAEAVFYLASDAASFVTGEILKVNGGFII